MDINEKIIKEYGKKIYGFAYSKTHNYHEAQDLSQNIILTLCKINFSSDHITDMNGYIYRVCQYTWSNFLRANKPFWQCVDFTNQPEAISDNNTEKEILQKELYQKLHHEIMRLAKNKREITILFYFHNMTGNEISEKLGIPPSTVRWYLGQSKRILKERIKMTNTIYTPKSLKIYFCGKSQDFNLSGLRNDLLVQNICIACEKKPLTIEEIASTLGIAAAFIENKMESLIRMNYIEKLGSNKYKTTFFIQDADFYIAKKQFEVTYIPPIANALYKAVKKNLQKIKNIGFYGCDLNDNFLLWTFITIAAHDYEVKTSIPLNTTIPIRGDGSRHWIIAQWQIKDIFDAYTNLESEFKEYIEFSGGYAGKFSGNEKIAMQQFDPAILLSEFRPILTLPDLENLRRIYTIIKSKIPPNEHDKEIFALLAEKGYVSATNGMPSVLIPYFTSEEYNAFRRIMEDTILLEVEKEIGAELNKEYAAYIRKKIPNYVSENEKSFLISRFYEPNAFTYFLLKNGSLAFPDESEKKRICSIVWEN